MLSRKPPASAAITAEPDAIASSATSPQVSVCDGNTLTSALAYSVARASRGRNPLGPGPHGGLEEPDAVRPAVLGEVGVEGGHERHAPPQRVAAAGEPQCAFRVYVDDVRRRGGGGGGGLAERRQRHADVRIQR